jgi:vacuolar iron transporter family protein
MDDPEELDLRTHVHVHSPHAEVHRSQRAPWLRAAVLGAQDGVVSTACLLVGVAGAGVSVEDGRLAGIAALVAGALSMAVGEYSSVGSQRDAERADLAIEQQALVEHPRAELEELTQIWEARGLTREVASEVAQQLTEADALAAHARDELGMTELSAARPLQAGLTSAAAFSLGALIPLVAYLAAPGGSTASAVIIASLVALLVVGAASAALGGSSRVRAMVRIGVGGGAAMAASLGLGELTGAAVG